MADLEQLGDYEIIRVIASGGMGTVYLAKNIKSGREVALKVLSSQMSEDPEFVARFQREAQATAALRHPHVVQVYDTGVVDGNRYIAMEYLSGGTLQKEVQQLIIKNEYMPIARAIQITRQIAGALDYAHKRGLIHRDIKPSNIMIAHDGRYVLTDFGIVMTQGGTKLTKAIETIGTPEYMAPEQIQGKTPDKRSDLYSLGIVLYEMLTGTAPFKAENTLAVLYKHVNEPPPTISRVRPELSSAIQSLVNKALAKDPDKRFQTAGEFIQALDRSLLGKSVESPVRRPALIRILIGTMGVALLVAIFAFLASRGIFIGSNLAALSTPNPIETAAPLNGTGTPRAGSIAEATDALATTQAEPTLTTSAEGEVTATLAPSAAATAPESAPETAPASIPATEAAPTDAIEIATVAPTAPPATSPAATATIAPSNTPGATATPGNREPTPIPISTSNPRAYLQAIANETLVRSGPTTDYDVVGQLVVGLSVPVIGRTKTDEYDWWQITYPQAPNGFGWVRGDVVSITGNPGLVPTAAPWALTPFSATIRLSPEDAGEQAIGANGRSNTLAVNWSVSGASYMELEITGEVNGAFDCPAGDINSVSPKDAVGKRRVLTLPSNEYSVTFNQPGYYVLNFYITRIDGGQQNVSRNVLVGCSRALDVTPTATITATSIP